ncbi:hypothetical protein EXU30_15235 [Shewanella maritima]|uniref:Uncharacterized protein n=1 Tax=Shewanella maritima TaxID=2520507 RepID=A0A411PK03_9GAMM|nr:hypothetical protein EXU30_15235 [Shewanella maritima]
MHKFALNQVGELNKRTQNRINFELKACYLMLNYHRWLDRLQVFERKSRSSSFYLLSLMCVAFLLGAAFTISLSTGKRCRSIKKTSKSLNLSAK